MLDRVATSLETSFKDAIAIASGTDFERTGVLMPSRSVWHRYARAALSELREPTHMMECAGYDAIVDGLGSSTPQKLVWYAMIDNALGEAA